MSYGLFGKPNLPNPRQVYLPIRLFQTQMAKVKGVPPVLLLVLWTLGSGGWKIAFGFSQVLTCPSASA